MKLSTILVAVTILVLTIVVGVKACGALKSSYADRPSVDAVYAELKK